MASSRSLFSILGAALLLSMPARAQTPTGSITGRVVDSTSQQPVANVNVIVEGTGRGTITRADGAYVIGGVPAGTHRLRAARIGYVAQTRDVVVSPGGS